jgi:predicted HicB family RNase H-like nuclease
MRLGKRVFSKTTIGSGKSVAGCESDEPYAISELRYGKVTVNIELDVAVALERLAQRRGESLTQIVNRVLRDYLNHQAQEPQPAQAQLGVFERDLI